jgi:RNA polymerase primary sigma factor
MAEASKIPVLKPGDEKALLAKAKAGDKEAAHAVVAGNIRFVVAVCWNYRNRGLPLPDLISEGNLALYQAIEHFDHSEVRFISYAVWWVRQAVLSALARQSGSVSFPPDRMYKALRLRRVENTLTQRLGRLPTPEEIGAMIGAGERTQASLAMILQGLSSRSERSSQAGDPLERLVDSQEEWNPETAVARHLNRKALLRRIGRLPPRDQRILNLRFGLGHGVRFSLAEVGSELGLTRERVRQIEARVLANLRKSIGEART